MTHSPSNYPVTSHYQSNFQNQILQLILKLTFATSLKILGSFLTYKHLFDNLRLHLGHIFKKKKKTYGTKEETKNLESEGLIFSKYSESNGKLDILSRT